MKGIRRSLKGSIGAPVPTYSSLPTNNFPSLNTNNNNRQSTSTTRPLNSPAPAPPKRVIRATESYRARSSQELSFELGDFFHVVSDDGGEDWFDAANPMTGAKGLVPARCFQVLGRNVRETAQVGKNSNNNNNINNINNNNNNNNQNNRPIPQQQQSYQSNQSNQQNQQQQQQSYVPTTQQSNFNSVSSPVSPTNGIPSPTTPKSQPLYGIVQYDFVAERADELDAKRGEPIIVIAQSNHEWFVAKPIGRLGGPGLIPVAFVEIQDMTTGKPVENVEELIRSAVVPKVEEWKKMTADYKSASIPLGRFDFAQGQAPAMSNIQGNNNNNNGTSNNYTGGVSPAGSGNVRIPSQYDQQNDDRSQNNQQLSAQSNSNRQSYEDQQQRQQQQQEQQQQQQQQQQDQDQQQQQQNQDQQQDDNNRYSYARERRQYGLVISASVESFHQEEGSFWFHLRAHFSTGASLILYRLYQDFYDFQIALMDEFPVEAGRIPPGGEHSGRPIERILPMMPGPTDFEDETVCAQRVFDLSVYLDDLCKLPPGLRAAGLMYEFFATRAGDVEVAVGDGKGDLELLNNNNGGGNAGGIEGQYGELVEYLNQMDGPDGRAGSRNQQHQQQQDTLGMDRLQMNDDNNNSNNNNNGGGERTSEYRSDSRQQQDRSNSRQQQQQSQQQQQQQQQQDMRSNSRQQQDRSNSRQQERSRGEGRTTSGYSEDQYAYSAQQSQHQKQPSYQSTYPSPPVSSQPSFSSNTNQSSQSSSSALPFVKIKIFHRNTDDLIAIRVPPNVTHASLLEKVRERLGGDVINLRFREEVGANGQPINNNGRNGSGGSNTTGQVVMAGGARLIGIDSDDDLDRWIRGGSRLVLYAD